MQVYSFIWKLLLPLPVLQLNDYFTVFFDSVFEEKRGRTPSRGVGAHTAGQSIPITLTLRMRKHLE